MIVFNIFSPVVGFSKLLLFIDGDAFRSLSHGVGSFQLKPIRELANAMYSPSGDHAI
jgi:hypothetical protein